MTMSVFIGKMKNLIQKYPIFNQTHIFPGFGLPFPVCAHVLLLLYPNYTRKALSGDPPPLPHATVAQQLRFSHIFPTMAHMLSKPLRNNSPLHVDSQTALGPILLATHMGKIGGWHWNCLILFGLEQIWALQNGLPKCPVHMWFHELFSIMTIISVSRYVSNLGTSKPPNLMAYHA